MQSFCEIICVKKCSGHSLASNFLLPIWMKEGPFYRSLRVSLKNLSFQSPEIRPDSAPITCDFIVKVAGEDGDLFLWIWAFFGDKALDGKKSCDHHRHLLVNTWSPGWNSSHKFRGSAVNRIKATFLEGNRKPDTSQELLTSHGCVSEVVSGSKGRPLWRQKFLSFGDAQWGGGGVPFLGVEDWTHQLGWLKPT